MARVVVTSVNPLVILAMLERARTALDLGEPGPGRARSWPTRSGAWRRPRPGKMPCSTRWPAPPRGRGRRWTWADNQGG